MYLAGLVAYTSYADLLVDEQGALTWVNRYHAENIAQTMKATKPWIEETREFFFANMIWLSKIRDDKRTTLHEGIEVQTHLFC